MPYPPATLTGAGWIVDPIVNPESGTVSPGLQKSLGGGGWTVTPLVSPCSGLPSTGYNKTLGAGGWIVDPIPDPCNDLASQVAALFAAGGFKGTMVSRDMPTLDQDNLGVSPVTALNQTVGRRKDQSGLANHFVQATLTARPLYSALRNLFTNSAWLGGGAVPTGWTQPGGTGTSSAQTPIDGNVPYRFVGAAQRPYFASPNISLAVGEQVTVSAVVEAIAVGASILNLTTIVPVTAAGTNEYFVDGVLVAGGTMPTVGQRIAVTYTCTTAGSVTARIGVGTQGNSTADVTLSRPMQTRGIIAQQGRYQRTGLTAFDYDDVGFPRVILFDTVDDALVATFPVALGTNCTVVRYVPGVGVVVLTGQTIGTSYTDTASNHCLAIFDGPLNPAQTALVTAWATQQAQP